MAEDEISSINGKKQLACTETLMWIITVNQKKKPKTIKNLLLTIKYRSTKMKGIKINLF